MGTFQGWSEPTGGTSAANGGAVWAHVVEERTGPGGERLVLLRPMDGPPKAVNVPPGPGPASSQWVTVLASAGLEHDRAGQRFFLRGARLELTPREYRLLAYFEVNRNRLLVQEQLLEACFESYLVDRDGKTSDKARVYCAISRLREKLGELGDPLIETERGVGYRCNADPLVV